MRIRRLKKQAKAFFNKQIIREQEIMVKKWQYIEQQRMILDSLHSTAATGFKSHDATVTETLDSNVSFDDTELVKPELCEDASLSRNPSSYDSGHCGGESGGDELLLLIDSVNSLQMNEYHEISEFEMVLPHSIFSYTKASESQKYSDTMNLENIGSMF